MSLTGSLVLGLAVAEEVRDAGGGWALSRIDEEWQNAQWGRDAEADAAAARRQGEFLEASGSPGFRPRRMTAEKL